MIPLYSRLPAVAQAETRTAWVMEGNDWGLPPDAYGFPEFYCEEPGCDCRRVLVNVLSEKTGAKILATINYGWESKEYYARWSKSARSTEGMAGASLDPINPQSELAPALLSLFEFVVQDRAYVERLKRHYAQFRGAAGGQPPEGRIRRAPRLQVPQPRGRRRK